MPLKPIPTRTCKFNCQILLSQGGTTIKNLDKMKWEQESKRLGLFEEKQVLTP
jgi:hypothetical protein